MRAHTLVLLEPLENGAGATPGTALHAWDGPSIVQAGQIGFEDGRHVLGRVTRHVRGMSS